MLKSIAFTFSFFLPVAAAAAVQPLNLLENGDFSQAVSSWDVPTDRATAYVVDAKAGPFRKALHIPIRPQAGDVPWSVTLGQSVDAAYKKGDALNLKVWLRSPEGLKAAGYLEETKAPNAKWLAAQWTLTPEWKEYEITGPAVADVQPGETRIVFHLDYGAGSIEVAGVRLSDANSPHDPRPARPTPDKPQSLVQDGLFDAPLDPVWSHSDVTLLPIRVVPAQAGPYRQALRVKTSVAANNEPWTLQVGQIVNAYIGRGEAVYAQAWMRSPDRVHVGWSYELAAPPYPKMISQTVRLTPEWKEYRFVGYAPQTFGVGESQFKFFFGYDRGTAEIAGVRVQDYGKAPRSLFHETLDYWNGQEHSDAWRAPALARIEKLRKGDLKIRVLDRDGKPAPGAKVTVQQKEHYFHFGTAAPANRLLDTAPDSLRFQSEVKRLFNTITFENDLKWQDYPLPNEKRMKDVAKAITWLNGNGAPYIRAHNLLWGSKTYLPAAVQALDTPALLQACHDRVTEEVTRWKGKVYIWDIVNEATDNTWLWDKIGWENFANAYRWAREADPNVLLCYNDYHGLTSWPQENAGLKREEERIQYLVDHNAPLDVIGEQAHLGPSLIPITGILGSLDNLAKYHKPIEITEFDLGLPDDATHGEYYRDFLTAVFSHPAVHGIIQWGFWEGAHWRAKESAAPFRQDWSKRPAEQAYEDLVLHQWWTHANLQTGADGRCATRAFYGVHQATVQAGGHKTEQEIQLLPGGTGEVVINLK